MSNPPPQTIYQLVAAWFRAYWNELALDQKKDAPLDPVKVRGGGWFPSVFLVLSGDLLSGDDANPTRHSKAEYSLRTDDHPDAGLNAGCHEWRAQLPGTTDDANNRLLMRLTNRAGLEIFCPLKIGEGDSIVGGGVNSSGRMTSPNGRYWWQVQDDGNVVLYDALDPALPVVLADLWSIQARLAALEG